MPKFLACAAIATVALSGCAQQETSREAAAVEVPPACASGFASICTVSPTETSGTVAVANGATVIFGATGESAPSVRISEVCWAGEDDIDPTTCVSPTGGLPGELTVVASSQSVNGGQWPSYTIRVDEMTDDSGEKFFPLPARITFVVDGSKSSEISVEVACCDAPVVG